MQMPAGAVGLQAWLPICGAAGPATLKGKFATLGEDWVMDLVGASGSGRGSRSCPGRRTRNGSHRISTIGRLINPKPRRI
jgi:hypothetical protein